MQNITVNSVNVRIMKECMNKVFVKAAITGKGTFSQLEASERALAHGRCILATLIVLELIDTPERRSAETEIVQIEKRIAEVTENLQKDIYERHMPGKGGAP